MVIQDSAVAIDIQLIRSSLQILLAENDACLLENLTELTDCDLTVTLGIILGKAHVKSLMELIARTDDLVDDVAFACFLDREGDCGWGWLLVSERSNLDEDRDSFVELNAFTQETYFTLSGSVDDSTVKLVLKELLTGVGVLG